MIIVDAPAKPNSSQADYPVRRDASEVLCVEKTRTRHETITWSIPCKTIIVNIDFLFFKLSGEDELTGMPSASAGERLQGFSMVCYTHTGGVAMAGDEDQEHDRLFTLSEANHLIPQLQSRLVSVRQAKAVLARTKDDIRRASARAEYGGGSTVGPLYLSSLHKISSNVQAIQEMGVLVKDLDLGLCDFPHLREGRVVFLCWKLGEHEIKWWHETTSGYKDRCPLEDSV
jgi:hypothetical protein